MLPVELMMSYCSFVSSIASHCVAVAGGYYLAAVKQGIVNSMIFEKIPNPYIPNKNICLLMIIENRLQGRGQRLEV